MTAAPKRLSADQYLAREERAKQRSEYVAGDVYALVGTSMLHNRDPQLHVAHEDVAGLLREAREERSAEVQAEPKLDAFFYPDVMVSCGVVLDQTKSFLTDAQLVIEVLSKGTSNIDRELKLQAYRKLPSLKEYVLVSQGKRQVELYRRGPDVGWTYLSFEGEQTMKLESVSMKLPLSTLYAGTKVS